MSNPPLYNSHRHQKRIGRAVAERRRETMQTEEEERRRRSTWLCGIVHVKSVFIVHLVVLALSAVYLSACATGLMNNSCEPLGDFLVVTAEFNRTSLVIVAVYILISVFSAVCGLHVAAVVHERGCRYCKSCNFPPAMFLAPVLPATLIYLVPFIMYTFNAIWEIPIGHYQLFGFDYKTSAILMVLALVIFWMASVYWLFGVLKAVCFVWEQSSCWSDKVPKSALIMSLQKVNVEASNFSSDSNGRPPVLRPIDRNDTAMAQRIKPSAPRARYDINGDGDNGNDLHNRGRHSQATAKFATIFDAPNQINRKSARVLQRMDAIIEDDNQIAVTTRTHRHHHRSGRTTEGRTERGAHGEPADIFNLSG